MRIHITSYPSIFTLEIKNYFNQVKKTPNFNLIYTYGSVVIPKINLESESSTSIPIKKFELHINSIKVKNWTNQDVVTYYNEASKSKSNLEVFGIAQS